MSIQDLMGKVVLVDRVYKRTHPASDPLSERSGEYKKVWQVVGAQGRPGWIVGERWIQSGATEWSMGGDDPPTWREDERVHVLLVTYWPTMKPVRVPFDGYRFARPTVRPYPTRYKWTEWDKEIVRKDMKNWPRDEKGRWVAK